MASSSDAPSAVAPPSSTLYQFTYETEQVEPDTILSYNAYRGKNTPIVIDNGSYVCRAGWAGQANPHLKFRSLVGKVRGNAGNFVGNDMTPADYVKMNARSAFDKEIVYNYDTQESVFDHIFSKLGIDTETVDHPVFLTETICNPSGARRTMSELLFETYNIPSLSYGIDALSSHYYAAKSMKSVDPNTALVVRSGFNTTHIMPIVNGICQFSNCKRINVGGYECTDLLLKLMQLKYPSMRSYITVQKAEEIKEKHCYVSDNYSEEIRKLATDKAYFQQQSHVFQLPYFPKEEKPEKSAEELQELKKKRRAHGEKLRQLAAQRQEEKKIEQEQQLKDLEELKALKENPNTRQLYYQRITEYGYDDEVEMEETFQFLSKKVKSNKKRKTTHNQESPVKETNQAASPVKSESQPPAVTSTASASSSEPVAAVKEEVPAATDATPATTENAQPPAPATTVTTEQKQANEENQEKKLRQARQKRTQLLQKIQQKLRQQKLKQQQQQQQQQQSSASSKSRRKSEQSKKRLKAMVSAIEDKEGEDTFGMEDDDWNIYMLMQDKPQPPPQESTSLSEDERELGKLDTSIQDLEQELYGKSTHTITKLYYNRNINAVPGESDDDFYLKQFKQIMSVDNQKTITEQESYQMVFTVERMRIPEIIFQPSIVGNEQAGIIECIETILKNYPAQIQALLTQNIYLCGGNMKYPNMQQRIEAEVTKIRPVGSVVRVASEHDTVNAWRGASLFAEQNKTCFFTRADYDEYGLDYFKEHSLSNKRIK